MLSVSSAGSAQIDWSDAAVLEKLRAGDDALFESFVREMTPRALATARRIVGSDADAADAVQDAFVSALQNLTAFRGASKLSTWFHRVVVNSALMKLRSKRRRRERSTEDLLPAYMDDGHQIDPPSENWPATADEILSREETRRAVYEKLAELPDNYRDVLLLRDIEGLTTAEISERLGDSEGALRVRIHRARQALRTLFEESFAK